jgi:AraC family transcriptional regulator
MMDGLGSATSLPDVQQSVSFTPPELIRRRVVSWPGLTAESVEITQHAPFEYGLMTSHHLLIAAERGERYDGETLVDGLPRSTLKNFSHKLSFVPAGHRFHGWQNPRTLAQATYFYIDPSAPLIDPELGFSRIAFKPRLFFEDFGLWQTALKLKALIAAEGSGHQRYAEALIVVLLHELMRINIGNGAGEPVVRGGLAGWQQKRVTDHIEANLDQPLSLLSLAGLARLSPYHFSRAFKESLGLPPHRYHTARRIERAKTLLEKQELSIASIALAIGFSETSSFTAAFHKLTGRTPSQYRRALV